MAHDEPAKDSRDHDDLEVIVSVASVTDYRDPARAVEVVRGPREVLSARTRPQPTMLPLVLGGTLGLVAVVALAGTTSSGWLALGVGAVSALFTVLFTYFAMERRRVPETLPRTFVRAGPRRIEVVKDGELGYGVESSSVVRVRAAPSVDGTVCVRVALDDGADAELLTGLTEDEAVEVVAQIDRALARRRAGVE